MTMIGENCQWRMTWTRNGSDQFSFINEERDEDGSWAYIDQWRNGGLSASRESKEAVRRS